MTDLENLRKKFKDKMPFNALEAFLDSYVKYKVGAALLIPWKSILTPDEKLLPHYDSLPEPNQEVVKNSLKSLVVCKLNGGLGTTMGCEGPKSSIIVRDKLSFLDIIIMQLKELGRQWQIPIPLVLMNSFYTHDETLDGLEKYREDLPITTFQQNRFPRLHKESYRPLDESKFGLSAWYPPGHGDFFNCIYHQGLLNQWLEDGRKLIFISNSDNLGALVDAKIANWMLESDCSFLMEVTDKTLADVKGGTLYQEAGRLRLLEVAQVLPENLDEFCDIKKFKTFNTNNIWINLAHLKKRCDKGAFPLPMISNPKNVNGVEVIQLETAIGFGVDNFPSSVGLIVPRSRYLPVKKTSDLFLAQSDLFTFKDGQLIRNPARFAQSFPKIQFDAHLSRLSDYMEKVSEVPSIVELESLKVEGDVRFDKGVVMKGNVVLTSKSFPLTIAADTVLDNEEIIN